MNREKAVAYSLLAHIRNTSTLINGPLDIFVPLIKRTLSIMNNEKIFGGENIYEINRYSKKLYGINFPTPVLRKILEIIVLEVNENYNGAFILNDDNSFSISNYTFVEFDESVRKRQIEIKKLEELFKEFCEKSKLKLKDSTSIFSFLEKNKLSLAKYLGNNEEGNNDNYLAEVQFINYFKKIPAVYDLIKTLYLGTILAEYVEYEPCDIKMDVELLFDTNFIVSLFDLNTPESTHTCNTLLKISKEQGYKLSILQETIEEIKCLIGRKAEYLNKTFLVKNIYTEDILNACERRKLTKVDLERMIDNIEEKITEYGITKISDNNELKKEALISPDYTFYRSKRTSEISALHDTMALCYVKKQRHHQKIKDFSDVKCWFVNNAISRGYDNNLYEKNYQPEIIKADDLLSILWLSNPQVSKLIPSNELADIGLSSLVSLTFTESLPKTSVIKEFEDNIQKYAMEDISSKDIIRVATRIADKQLTNIAELNKIATENQELFVKKLEKEAEKQAEHENIQKEAISSIMQQFKNEIEKFEEIKKTRSEKDKAMKELETKNTKYKAEINTLNQKIKETEENLKQNVIKDKIKSWKEKSRIYLIFFIGLFLIITEYIFLYDESLLKSPAIIIASPASAVIFGFLSKLFYDRHFNHGNIESFKKSLR